MLKTILIANAAEAFQEILEKDSYTKQGKKRINRLIFEECLNIFYAVRYFKRRRIKFSKEERTAEVSIFG